MSKVKPSRIFFFALVLSIAWFQFVVFANIESIPFLGGLIGMFAILFSGPALIGYALLVYKSESKKIFPLTALLIGLLWEGYLIKLLLDGESV
ncbi:hypothetical protein [Spirosoma sp. KNUC1025]|uniref:hypothetical protein n=1 Tax=Spirosoma sp. KNUC1025 TaxID=2894082 RepID=UPI0038655427|nr:hypothetical protein LN737_29860 [Spirosoma sp. KNUC1025]